MQFGWANYGNFNIAIAYRTLSYTIFETGKDVSLQRIQTNQANA